eukprot:gene2156-9002_t
MWVGVERIVRLEHDESWADDSLEDWGFRCDENLKVVVVEGGSPAQ